MDIELPSGWNVVSVVEYEHQSNKNFVTTYKVVRNGEVGLLKALDFSYAFRVEDSLKTMNYISDVFNHEATLLNICKDKQLTHIVKVIEKNELEQIHGSGIKIPYIIIEMSDDNVHNLLRFDSFLNRAWILKILHNLSVAFWQLEKQNINCGYVGIESIMQFNDNVHKLADLGNSELRGRISNVQMGVSNATIETLYGGDLIDWSDKMKTHNLYYLGSTMAMLFTNIDANNLFAINLREEYRYYNWRGTYDEVLPFLEVELDYIRELICSLMDNKAIEEKLGEIILQLLHPNPLLRGKKGTNNPFTMERFVQEMNELYQFSTHYR